MLGQAKMQAGAAPAECNAGEDARAARGAPDRQSGAAWNTYARTVLGSREVQPDVCWSCGSSIGFKENGLTATCSCGTISLYDGRGSDSVLTLLTQAGYVGKA
eukprot:TRINITY_DN27471_c0_g1_i2.p2 TRINITY_DN27471_c0_g1~~TRINITY_DN27471_c0_g1_i2.p2  ORF type:complete len:103 (-),score=21.67 TRINITY_DN27471_c0_g1_i2:252-560(-)